MRKHLWPDEDELAEVFAEEFDSERGRPIKDKHGCVVYGNAVDGEGCVGLLRVFPSLGINGIELLKLIDPDEHSRVEKASARRAAINARASKRPPLWLMLDREFCDTEDGRRDEELFLGGLDLTVEKVRALMEKG